LHIHITTNTRQDLMRHNDTKCAYELKNKFKKGTHCNKR